MKEIDESQRVLCGHTQEQIFNRLVDISHSVCLKVGVLLAGAHQLGEGSQQTFYPNAAHLDKLSANQWLAAFRQHRGRKHNHGGLQRSKTQSQPVGNRKHVGDPLGLVIYGYPCPYTGGQTAGGQSQIRGGISLYLNMGGS